MIKQINELAYKRSDAIEICKNNGLLFINHFHKCMQDLSENNINRLHHHAAEMSSWWNNVIRMKLTYNNKHLAKDQLVNWFFTAGSDIDEMIQDEYQDLYGEFMILLLSNPNTNVFDALIKLHSMKIN